MSCHMVIGKGVYDSESSGLRITRVLGYAQVKSRAFTRVLDYFTFNSILCVDITTLC